MPWRKYALLWPILFAVALHGQSIQLGSVQIANQAVQFQVQGQTGEYILVQSSPDLVNWLPVDLFLSGDTPHTTTDSFTNTNSARFYNAMQVDGSLQILQFSPASGGPGTQVQIVGQFIGADGQYAVDFGGVPAQIVSETPTLLTVIVPQGAMSSDLTVGSTNQSVTSDGVFVILTNAAVTVVPPAGLAASNFTVANFYGAAVPATTGSTNQVIPVRVGAPVLTFASGSGADSNLFLCAVSFNATQPITINVNSTADAMVFQNPYLFTSDPNFGPIIMGIIQSNSAVAALASALATEMIQSSEPYDQPDVTNAYLAAVESVLTNEGISELAKQMEESVPSTPRPKQLASVGPQIYELENTYTPIPFVEISAQGNHLTAEASNGHFNPVDWLVIFQDVDVNAAFPDGTVQFNQTVQNPEVTPAIYPTKGTFYTERWVEANLLSSRFDILGTLSKAIADALVPKISDNSVILPPGNGLYLVRAVGPALVTPEDFEFVTSNMDGVYVRVVAINIVNATLTLASLVIGDDAAGALKAAAKTAAIGNKAVQLAGGVQNSYQFGQAVIALLQSLAQDFTGEFYQHGFESIIEQAGESLVPLNGQLKTISTVGQVVERASGLFRTTTLESDFVQVGDAFALQILGVVPSTAAPGQSITVTFQGSPGIQPFNTNNPATDLVTFENGPSAPYYFDGQVSSVTGPDSTGVQTLSVLIPGDAPNGAYNMVVLTQGRRGNATFTVSSSAAISSVTPLQGFDPTTNFNGVPYAGTYVEIQGSVFSWSDQFLFTSSNGFVAATSVEPLNLSGIGDVLLTVPSGATTGPIKILHALGTGGTLTIPGPVFTVFGPPVITSVQPPGGVAAGNVVTLNVMNVGTDPNLVVALCGANSAELYLQPNGVVAVSIYPLSPPSSTLSIWTPAGIDTISYQITPFVPPTNLTSGASISFGGLTGISLAQAMAFANGTATPNGYQLTNGIGGWTPTNLFLGPGYLHYISGASGDSAAINCNNNTFNGTLSGNVVLSGTNNRCTFTLSGTLSVPGYGNTVGGTFSGPATVSGMANNILATFTGVSGNALTVTGNFNYGTMDIVSNAGDGLVINGGSNNNFTLNQSFGNAGNGATLTGGAVDNALFGSTGSGVNQFGTPGTGNLQHGVALLGSAIGNGILMTLAGNGLDGLYMDGPNVTQNSFTGGCYANARNGITITNGASGNSVGSVGGIGIGDNNFQAASFNLGSGVVCAGCGPNDIVIGTQSNGLYGVRVTNVQVAPGSFQLLVNSGSQGSPLFNSTEPLGNGRAAIRLENGTSGMDIFATTLNGDYNGIEIDGPDTTNNQIECTISGETNDGIFISGGASSNEITTGITACLVDGILLQEASNNLVQVFASTLNGSNGIHLTQGSSGNQIVEVQPVSIYYGPDVGDYIENNLMDGCLVDSGAHDNDLSSLIITSNAQDGLAFSGPTVSGNILTSSQTLANGRDGVRFELGAFDNILGADVAETNTSFRVFGPPVSWSADCVSSGNGESGVLITDPGTSNNLVRNCAIGVQYYSGQIYLGPDGFLESQPVGILVSNQAGSGQILSCTIQDNTNGIMLVSGAHTWTLGNLAVAQNTNAGIVLSNAYNVLVGGDLATNYIFQNLTGVDISGALATNNAIINNYISSNSDGIYIHQGAQQNQIVGGNVLAWNFNGLRVENSASNLVDGADIISNQANGIVIALGSVSNQITGCSISDNNTGVLVSGQGSVGNTVSGNSITGNTSLGIELSADGNNMIAPPTLLYFNGGAVSGTNQAPDGSIVEIFSDPGGQGQIPVGVGLTANGQFNVTLTVDPASLIPGWQLNGTVTDPAGNTSQFSSPSLIQPGFPQPSLLAFTSPGAMRQIFLSMNASAPTDLSSPSDDDFSPNLSLAGGCGKVVFVSDRSGKEQIYVKGLTNTAAEQELVATSGDNFDPAWLVACQSIVFAADASGTAQIYSMNIDGSGLQRLATNSATEDSPATTADGKKIVFVSDRSGVNALWVMQANGTDPQLVGGISGPPGQPAISADGTTIALTVTVGAATEIAIVGIDGSNFQQITSDGKQATHPTWLPDGQHIIFSSNRKGQPSLYSIERSGANLQPLPFQDNLGSEPTAGNPSM
ncbi:MAG TPA: right-handed parallel beta-helix repeat-containing protein [Candidatus Baltobacteraceae bacterium]|nr:right-handed parallel beta-helix repeat-containing protein [Candidatus Baltobacteraceae bacterium]